MTRRDYTCATGRLGRRGRSCVTATRVTAVSALRLPLHHDLAIVVEGHGVLGDDQADVVAEAPVQHHHEHTSQSAGHRRRADLIPAAQLGGKQPLELLPVGGRTASGLDVMPLGLTPRQRCAKPRGLVAQ